jgi:GGDEF domain-containing protein
MSAWRAGRALLGSTFVTTPQGALWSAGAIGLEAAARALGRYDVLHPDRTHAVWKMSPTTKQHIPPGTSATAQYNVAVFHIVNFHRLQLEIGAQASRQLARRVADRIQQALGGVPVTVQEAGTTVAMLPGDRAAAKRAAGAVLQLFEATPITSVGRGPATPVTLSCGIIAFPPSGQLRQAEVPAPSIELELAIPVTT